MCLRHRTSSLILPALFGHFWPLVIELHHMAVSVSSQAQMLSHSQVSYFQQLSYLRQKPGVILSQSLPVSFCCHISIAEAVLHGGCSANVFVKEFLPRLLGDGFGWHGARWLKKHCRERYSNSLTISHLRPINEQQCSNALRNCSGHACLISAMNKSIERLRRNK